MVATKSNKVPKSGNNNIIIIIPFKKITLLMIINIQENKGTKTQLHTQITTCTVHFLVGVFGDRSGP